MSMSFLSLHEKVHGGMWVPISTSYARPLVEGLTTRWFGLPVYAELPYIDAVMRIVERVPEDIVRAFDYEEMQKLPVGERIALAAAARERLGIFHFQPCELNRLCLDLHERAYPSDTRKRSDVEERICGNYKACHARIMDFSAYLEQASSKHGALRTSHGDIPSPMRPKLALVK